MGVLRHPHSSIINNQAQNGIQMSATRNTYYATICYPESAPTNWLEILKELHIQALVSPLHNKDVNKDGTPKKAHYHIILLFESLKSEQQVQALANSFGGVKVIPVHSLGAYSRYLCHMDDLDKAQYSKEDIIEIGGADYKECCRQNDNANQEKNLIKLTHLVLDNDITYFHKVAEIVLQDYEDLFCTLSANSYYIRSIVVSLATEKEERRNFLKS